MDKTVYKCSICMVNDSVFAIIPCGHVCGCKSCLDKPSIKECPICRGKKTGILRIFQAGLEEDLDLEQNNYPHVLNKLDLDKDLEQNNYPIVLNKCDFVSFGTNPKEYKCPYTEPNLDFNTDIEF